MARRRCRASPSTEREVTQQQGEPDALDRFPEAVRHTASDSIGSPPRWPVSGLTENTRDAFPVAIAFAKSAQWLLCHDAPSPAGLASAYRCGTAQVESGLQGLLPPDSRLTVSADRLNEHQRCGVYDIKASQHHV